MTDEDKPAIDTTEGSKEGQYPPETPIKRAKDLKADELHEEDLKLRKLKRELSSQVVNSAIGIHIVILFVASLSLLFGGSFWAFSAAVVSFVWIYGTIIKYLSPSSLSSTQEHDSYYGMIKKILKYMDGEQMPK